MPGLTLGEHLFDNKGLRKCVDRHKEMRCIFMHKMKECQDHIWIFVGKIILSFDTMKEEY